MKTFSSLLAFSALTVACALPLVAQQAAPKKKVEPLPNAGTGGTTPHATTSTVIGGRGGPRVMVVYGRPNLKQPRTGEVRKVWGGLVPWDKAYRLGADEATLLVTPVALQVGATTIPAGAYTLYLVPSETGATKLAVSKNIGKWGIPIDETTDLARLELKRETLEKSVEQLTIAIENVPAGGAVLKISWENLQFSLPFTIKS